MGILRLRLQMPPESQPANPMTGVTLNIHGGLAYNSGFVMAEKISARSFAISSRTQPNRLTSAAHCDEVL